MKHAFLFLTAFGLWLLLGCSRKATDDKEAPPHSPPQPQPPLSRAAPGEKPRGPSTKSLLQATVRGNVNDVTVCVERDPEAVHRPNAEGFYPIHLAAEQGHSEVIRVLLRAGADVNTPHPKVQATPLQYAAMHGHLDAVRTLLAAGARVDSVDNIGRTPLMWAASEGRGEVVQELLKHGAKANCTTKAGWTALRYAEDKGHAQVAELLRK
jgi:ankyrin repeat protein